MGSHITVAGVDHEKRYMYGLAACAPGDSFDRKVGQILAMRRLIALVKRDLHGEQIEFLSGYIFLSKLPRGRVARLRAALIAHLEFSLGIRPPEPYTRSWVDGCIPMWIKENYFRQSPAYRSVSLEEIIRGPNGTSWDKRDGQD
jgi:hypothetical protein